ncbi:MAG: FAD-binding protein [Candidatus Omnitrophica bacterium]|nr:FAD-binding protein [Candidatus Omnitrophota bacterium]
MYDFIVVGGGGSGLAAAARGVELGLSVLVLEKQPQLGGTTGIAVGSYTTSGSALQRKAGIEDSVEDHAEDAGKFPPLDIEAKNNAAYRHQFLSHAAETLEWLTGMGLVFHGPSPEPPNRVPRMHNVVPGAQAYILTLQSKILAASGTILCETSVKRLLKEDGRIVGVKAERGGKTETFRSRLGVILAAGDYAAAPDLIAEFKGDSFSEIEGINPNACGDGHRLAREAGSPLVNMEITYGPELRFIPPDKKDWVDTLGRIDWVRNLMGKMTPLVPESVMHAMIKKKLVTWQHPEDKLFPEGAILINQEGERFCNELETPDRETRVACQTDKISYILLDQGLIEKFSEWPDFISTAPEIAYAYVEDYLRLRPDVAAEAGTLEALARKRDIPSGRLKEAVQTYNQIQSENGSDPFGRPTGGRPLEGDRWVLLGPAKAYFTTTEGSPACDLEMRVLDRSGEPIPGLYAVGQNGLGGQVLWGHGLHIAWAMTSGRLVAEGLKRMDEAS